jgi:hypothetical protein
LQIGMGTIKWATLIVCSVFVLLTSFSFAADIAGSHAFCGFSTQRVGGCEGVLHKGKRASTPLNLKALSAAQTAGK